MWRTVCLAVPNRHQCRFAEFVAKRLMQGRVKQLPVQKCQNRADQRGPCATMATQGRSARALCKLPKQSRSSRALCKNAKTEPIEGARGAGWGSGGIVCCKCHFIVVSLSFHIFSSLLSFHCRPCAAHCRSCVVPCRSCVVPVSFLCRSLSFRGRFVVLAILFFERPPASPLLEVLIGTRQLHRHPHGTW